MSLTTATTSIVQLHSKMNLQQTLNINFGKLIVIVFYADWNKQAVQFKSKIMASIKLFGQFNNVAYIFASAQEYPQIFKLFSVEYAPTVIFTDPLGNIIRKFETQDEAIVLDALPQESQNYRIYFEKQAKQWFSKIESIAKQSPIVLFTTSNPLQPTRQTERILSLLNKHQITFNLYNSLEDHKLSQWLKYYTKKKAFPLLFVDNKFLGNTETCQQLQQQGLFLQKMPKSSLPVKIKQKFEQLIKDHKVIVFTDKINFENTQQQLLINKLKFPSSQISIFNLTINKKLKEYISITYQKKLPLLFVEGQLQQ